jgi:hypothetical protein
LLPLDSHFHEDSIDSSELLLETDHAYFLITIFEKEIFIINTEIQIVDLVLEVAKLMQALAAEVVDVDLVGGLFGAVLHTDCQQLLTLGEAETNDLNLLPFFFQLSSINAERIAAFEASLLNHDSIGHQLLPAADQQKLTTRFNFERPLSKVEPHGTF